MRYIFVLMLSSLCGAQTIPTTGQAESMAPCSVANTGNDNKIQINCGIDREQGQKILAILNKILAERLDLTTVMDKLDEIQRSVQELKPSPPTVTWKQEDLKPGVGLNQAYPHGSIGYSKEESDRRARFANNPGVLVTLSPDTSWANPAFMARCDKPCESIDALAKNVGSQIAATKNADGRPAIIVFMPARLTAGQEVVWEIRSSTADQIKVTSVIAATVK